MHKTVEKMLLEYNPEITNLLPALKKISAVFGYVSETNAQKTADYFSIPLSKVFETASFYDLINIQKNPSLVIQVCDSANCAVSGSFEIVREIENTLKIKAGDKFNPEIRLETMSCVGRCGEGPVVIINNQIFTQVTRSSVHEILRKWI